METLTSRHALLLRTLSFSTLLAGALVGPLVGAQGQQAPTVVAVPTKTASTKASPELAGIAHVALRVHDLDAAVSFYQKLGFVKAFELARDGKVYEAFIKINDRQFLELYPATPQSTQIGFLHLCFEGNDLPAVHDFYVANGLQPNEVRTAGAGNLLFTMHGPVTPTGDQNLEYTQYMPGSLHSKDFGQHLGAGRISTRLVSVTVAANDPATASTFYTEKLAFHPSTNGRLALPGAGEESVSIVPVEPLGFRARITLEIKDAAKTNQALKQRALAFTREHDALVVSDPDSNQIVLAPAK